MNTVKKQQGFTIIEVVLVLAIAALIFLMIFIALPALQRGQRDTARKNEVGTIASAVNTYRSNQRGALPGATADMNGYLDNLNQITTVTVQTGGYTAPALDTAHIYVRKVCTNNASVVGTGTAKQAAVVTAVENGTVYCQDV